MGEELLEHREPAGWGADAGEALCSGGCRIIRNDKPQFPYFFHGFDREPVIYHFDCGNAVTVISDP